MCKRNVGRVLDTCLPFKVYLDIINRLYYYRVLTPLAQEAAGQFCAQFAFFVVHLVVELLQYIIYIYIYLIERERVRENKCRCWYICFGETSTAIQCVLQAVATFAVAIIFRARSQTQGTHRAQGGPGELYRIWSCTGKRGEGEKCSFSKDEKKKRRTTISSSIILLYFMRGMHERELRQRWK